MIELMGCQRDRVIKPEDVPPVMNTTYMPWWQWVYLIDRLDMRDEPLTVGEMVRIASDRFTLSIPRVEEHRNVVDMRSDDVLEMIRLRCSPASAAPVKPANRFETNPVTLGENFAERASSLGNQPCGLAICAMIAKLESLGRGDWRKCAYQLLGITTEEAANVAANSEHVVQEHGEDFHERF